MQVIVAGMPKTGTKTLAKALSILGYKVYDYMQHFQYHRKYWEKILLEGGSLQDYEQMYANVDAVTDIPACFYWEELLEAYPNAKIIFMQTDSEEIWFTRMKGQLTAGNAIPVLMLALLSPTARAIRRFTELIVICVFACKIRYNFFGKASINKSQYTMMYKRHNTNLLQNAPKEQLLQYSALDGWAPLCKFLGKETPEIPFPHENKRGTSLIKLFKDEPVLGRIFKEAAVILSCFFLVFAYVVYFLCVKQI